MVRFFIFGLFVAVIPAPLAGLAAFMARIFPEPAYEQPYPHDKHNAVGYQSCFDPEDTSVFVNDIAPHHRSYAAKGYDLSPNKYVKYHKEEVKPYAEVLAEFKAAYQNMIEAEQKFRNILNREAV